MLHLNFPSEPIFYNLYNSYNPSRGTNHYHVSSSGLVCYYCHSVSHAPMYVLETNDLALLLKPQSTNLNSSS